MLSWGIPSTVVELVPSIPSLLPFYQVDGDRLLTAPGGRIIIDDARRFLERSKESFSVVVVDPPPPIEAAASSLLYSREFYSAVVKRLAPDGILQQWIPWDADGFEDKKLLVAMTMALSENFPYVRAFRSLEGWGLHFLASKMPIPTKTPAQLAAMLPKKASEDIVEWGPFETPQEQFAKVLSQEVPLQEILDLSPRAPVLSDDRPLNEYYLLRKYSH
jgi:spermidine synthase